MRRWRTCRTRLAEAILKDPDVDRLKLVHRRRRHQSDAEHRPASDQSQAARRAQAHRDRRSSAAFSRRSSGIVGITLYMQPVQDLTIDATISRAPYHFVLEDANPKEFNTWVPRVVRPPQPIAAAHRRCQRPGSSRGWRSISSSTAPPPPASASRRRPSTMRSTTPSASASFRPSTPSRTSIA